MNKEPTLFRIDRLALTLKPKPWAFAVERRAEIDAYFAERQRDNPALWNGRVLLLYHQVVRDGVFYGDFLETDYASFSAWKSQACPPAGVRDCFGAAAVVGSNGGVLVGVMNTHTANAGRTYFPCGTPDPDDIVGSTVDFDVSVRRELLEETGIDAATLMSEPDWTAVVDGVLIMHVKLLRSHETAEALRAHALAHIAGERQPELRDIRIVRSEKDFDPAMPRFVTAFLVQHFGVG
jgi:8-oxo-dGTP pyrophosphatase MutT (NUDIX family)